MSIFKLIRLFQKANGRSPSPNELAKLKQQADIMSKQENVIPFPQGGKDKLNPFDDFKASEDAFEESLDPKRIKGGISTKIKLNSFRENQQYTKDLIGGKSAEFNTLKSEDRKEVLDLLEAQIKKDTNPIDPDDMPFADGGRAGFNVGGIINILSSFKTLFKGKYKDFLVKKNRYPSIKERTKLIDEAEQEIKTNFPKEYAEFSNPSQSFKTIKGSRVNKNIEADMERESMGFFPKTQEDEIRTVMDDGPEMTFDDVVNLRLKKQSGGLAGLLGEPRSEYGAGGGTGAPPITYDDTDGKPFGPGPTMPPNTMMNTPSIDPRMLNQGRGTGINIDPRALQNGRLQIPTQGLADGGRIGFKDGGMNRRSFLKLMGGLAALPIVGKFFKGAKVASKVVPLKGTTTTMPAWFPDLVDKFVAKGVGKKIDADIIEYKTKDLPGITMTKHDDGKIFVEGKNDYGRPYEIEYETPGYEVVDYDTGKAVKTKGEFRASEEVPINADPDGNIDFDGEILESVDDILSSDARIMEEFATSKKIKKIKRGEFSVGQAEAKADAARKGEDFASGGIAGMLGFQDGGRIGFDNGNIVRNLTKAGKFTGYGLAGEAAFAAPFALADYAAGESGDRILGNATFGLFGETEQEEIKKATGDLGYATQIIDDLKSRLPMLKKQLESFNDKNDPTGVQRDKFANIYNKLGDQYNQEVNKFIDDEGQFNKNLYNQALNNYTAGLNQIGKFKDQLAKERPDERTGLESYDVALAGGGLSRLLGE